jgi:hypothetical protein
MFYEKIQLAGFSIQECIISGLYLWETTTTLKPIAVTRGMSEWIVLFVTVYQWPGALPSLYTATSVGPQDLSWVPHTTL